MIDLPTNNILDELKSSDIGKEILDSTIGTKKELREQKKQIEEDKTIGEFEKMIQTLKINFQGKLLFGLDREDEFEEESKEDEQEKVNQNNPEEKREQIEIVNLNEQEQFIYNQAIDGGIQDPNQIAYILATVQGESWYKNIKEVDGEKKKYGKEWYYGRWYVQLTHKKNYQKLNKIIKESNKTFRDDEGNIMADIDIVKNPDLILQSKELSAFILIYGMKNGTFTNKKLDDFINNNKIDFYNARSIINGMSSAPQKYAQFAEKYQNKLTPQYT